MRTFVATTAKSADIMPETACYQRGHKKRTKISEIGGQGQEDILESNEGEEHEAKRRSSVKSGLFFAS